MHPVLVEALMQCGATALPEVIPVRNFRSWLEHDFERLCPSPDRFLAHPSGNFASVQRESRAVPVLAIGPEGGWTDDELSRFESHRFRRISLGPRILRTDTAAVALLGLLSKP